MSLPRPYPEPVTLTERGVRLEPLGVQHEEGLKAAAADGQLWLLRVTSVPEPENTRKYIDDALAMQRDGKRVPFAVVDAATVRVLGSSSYHDLIPATGRLEIGYTWYAQSVQRSALNTTVKLMLMSHAFDTLGYRTVGWRTDNFNFASQRAIERLGAKKEGVLRGHALRRDGTVRDTVIYSVTSEEWPEIKAHLLYQLTKPR
jgi:N-acetyltransferase